MKKFLIVVCVIGVIVFLGYIGTKMDLSSINGNNTSNTTNNSVITGKNNTSNNTSNNTNKTVNNTTNSTNETKNETENKDNTTNTANTTENNTTNTTQKQVEEVKTSDEDKAKELAQKAYGSSDGVSFKIEQVEGDGVYIISVRDIETTSALAWYNVNVKTGAVN